MNKLTIIFSAALLTLGFLSACNKKSDSTATRGSNLVIPKVTGPVSTTTAQSLSKSFVSSVQTKAANTLIGGSSPSGVASFAYFSGMMHFTISKLPDTVSCLVKTLVANGLVSSDGQEYIYNDTENNSKSKISITAVGGKLSNYKLYECTASVQTQFISAELSGENANFVFKNAQGASKTSLSVTGTFSSSWISKIVSIATFDGSSTYSAYRTTQYADAILAQYSTTGTQLYTKYGLSGSSTKDYAMGAGSVKATYTSGAVSHWDGNLADTGTASAFTSDVSSGSYLTIPTSYAAEEMSGNQVWDCQDGSATQVSTANLTQAQGEAIGASITTCLDGL